MSSDNNTNNSNEMNIDDVYSDDDVEETNYSYDDHNYQNYNNYTNDDDDYQNDLNLNENNTNDNNLNDQDNSIDFNIAQINPIITIDTILNNYNVNGLLDIINSDISNSYSSLFTNITNINNINNNDGIDETSNTLDNILNSTFYDKPKYKNILSDKGENELKIIKFSNQLETNTSCPINQTDFTEGMEIIQLPCLHCFNIEGIKKWLKTEKAICPICRYELDYVEKEIKEEESYIQNRIQTRRTSFYNLINTVIEEQNEEDLQIAIINSLYERDNNSS